MRILSVTELTAYLRNVLDGDPVLSDVWLEGEVSNWSRAASGHCYMTLKDGDAQLRAVCWRQTAMRQPALPSNGDKVLVNGHVSFWEGSGQIQVYVDLIRPAGIGLLHAQVEALKQRLEAEGLFEQERKRLIPPAPRRIGLVTSPTGAALRDMLVVLARRWPLGEITVSPALVQGDGAPSSLVEALYNLYTIELDLIIVARGGGSIEDLWAFNDESVARAIFASPVPVITGVGHETDTTVVDYVADLRAATPSAAAELATPDIADIKLEAQQQLGRAHDALTLQLASARTQVQELQRRVQRLDPRTRLQQDRQRVDQLQQRLERSTNSLFKLQRLRLNAAQQQLRALSPHATLTRGYAIVRRDDGSVVLDPVDVLPDDLLTIDLRDGVVEARVTAS